MWMNWSVILSLVALNPPEDLQQTAGAEPHTYTFRLSQHGIRILKASQMIWMVRQITCWKTKLHEKQTWIVIWGTPTFKEQMEEHKPTIKTRMSCARRRRCDLRMSPAPLVSKECCNHQAVSCCNCPSYVPRGFRMRLTGCSSQRAEIHIKEMTSVSPDSVFSIHESTKFP